ELYNGLGLTDEATLKFCKSWGAVLIATAVTLYFFRQNLLGIHESSDKAMKIMIATTVMAVIMLVWCGVTLVLKEGPVNPVPWRPDLQKKVEYATDEKTGQWVKDPDRPGQLLPETDADGNPKPKESEALSKLGIKAQADPLGLLGRILPEGFVQR